MEIGAAADVLIGSLLNSIAHKHSLCILGCLPTRLCAALRIGAAPYRTDWHAIHTQDGREGPNEPLGRLHATAAIARRLAASPEYAAMGERLDSMLTDILAPAMGVMTND
ncbi:hypothetical protein GNZ12_24135 [Paraburkholderia sp. 1N]|uniref:Uncharacterized protein n=1 Tax=Paraburkholderia solitsugae TaxID=2675748 RepID=A0ABX2BWF0_9BURK|nr:hypothetical protein [Paraburkholderia solitsugae]